VRAAWLLVVAACAGSPRYVGEHHPSEYDCGYAHVCGIHQYCEEDLPLDHDWVAPDGERHKGKPIEMSCRDLPASCPRPFDCACLRAAHVPISSCDEEFLGNGRTSVEVTVERDGDRVLPLRCDELRCDPATSYCVEGEGEARCTNLPDQCHDCSCLGPDVMCKQVGDQLHVELPPPP
jgi:hypothetical protein